MTPLRWHDWLWTPLVPVLLPLGVLVALPAILILKLGDSS